MSRGVGESVIVVGCLRLNRCNSLAVDVYGTAREVQFVILSFFAIEYQMSPVV